MREQIKDVYREIEKRSEIFKGKQIYTLYYIFIDFTKVLTLCSFSCVK